MWIYFERSSAIILEIDWGYLERSVIYILSNNATGKHATWRSILNSSKLGRYEIVIDLFAIHANDLALNHFINNVFKI